MAELIEQDAYELKRNSQWKPKEKKKEPKVDMMPGQGDTPDDIKRTDNLKHNQRKVLSLINVPLWDKAKWSGSLFMIYPEGQFPPCIGLMFENEAGARDIFTGLIERLGKKDENDELRICIVTGVDKKSPPHYRIHIGSNINAYEKSYDQRQFVMVSRINTMTPDSDKNLTMFLDAYKKFGVYCLIPAFFEDNLNEPKVIRDLPIFKSKLVIKPAWEIGENDEDFAVLKADDDPIIPEEIKNAPVIKALERKRRT